MKQISNVLVIAAIVFSFGLVFYDIQPALAFSVTTFQNGTTDVRATVTKYGNSVGDITAVGDVVTDSVYLRNAHTQVLITTIGSVVDPAYAFTSEVASGNGDDFVYFLGGATGNIIYEIDIVDQILVRSVTTSCSAVTDGFYVDYVNGFFYCADATELVYKYSIGSLAPTFISSTFNAGGTPCDAIEGLSYDSASDTMFALCATTDNIVGVVGYLTSGTPDFSIATGAITGGQIAFNTREENIASCQNTLSPKLYNWSASTGFTFWKDLGAAGDNCAVNKYSGRMLYDFTSDRYFFMEDNNIFHVIDGTTGIGILTTTISTTGTVGMMQVVPTTIVNPSHVWGAIESNGANNDYYDVDLSGVALGSNGETGGAGGGTGGIDCTLEENENILICRLTGGECQGGVLQCVGNTVLGNSTDDSDVGLIDVICGVGFVDCASNPDIKTNGIGYLLLAVALGVEIGILWVASRGDLREVPTFIWFIASIAIVGAFTLMNFIDATFLVLSVITVVALAAAKARGLFGGGDSF